MSELLVLAFLCARILLKRPSWIRPSPECNCRELQSFCCALALFGWSALCVPVRILCPIERGESLSD